MGKCGSLSWPPITSQTLVSVGCDLCTVWVVLCCVVRYASILYTFFSCHHFPTIQGRNMATLGTISNLEMTYSMCRATYTYVPQYTWDLSSYGFWYVRTELRVTQEAWFLKRPLDKGKGKALFLCLYCVVFFMSLSVSLSELISSVLCMTLGWRKVLRTEIHLVLVCLYPRASSILNKHITVCIHMSCKEIWGKFGIWQEIQRRLHFFFAATMTGWSS